MNSATSATYQYDSINRLTQLTDNASLNTTFAYDATNKLTARTLPNGVVTTSQYDGLNRLTRLTHAKTGNTLADFQYQFNPVSSITQMIDGAGTNNYTYDTRDRLTAATHPNQTNEAYTLDDVGNRTASHQGSSYSYQTFNRLVTANSATFGYNANGNLTTKTDATGRWHVYVNDVVFADINNVSMSDYRIDVGPQPADQFRDQLKKAGWWWRWDRPNLSEEHKGGLNLQREVQSGRWIHITIIPVKDDWSKPPREIQLHCERFWLQPTSLKHLWDHLTK